MPKTISGSMASHLETELTSLATCWELTRQDGTVFYFTDHDQDLIFDGNTYLAATGFTRSALETTSTLAVDNMELAGLLDSAVITEEDVRAGLFDYAALNSFIVNHEDPDSFSSIKLRSGFLGELTTTSEAGTFNSDFRGLSQNYSQNVGNLYQDTCRADFGDSRCGVVLEGAEVERTTAYAVGDVVSVDLDGAYTDGRQYKGLRFVCTTAGTTDGSEPTYNETIDGTTTDGTAVFTTAWSYTQYLEIVTVTSAREYIVDTPVFDVGIFIDDYFKYGVAIVLDTSNDFKGFEIKRWDAAGLELDLFLGASYLPEAGDIIKVTTGCKKDVATDCRDRFDNVINFRGEPFIPGLDQILSTPTYK